MYEFTVDWFSQNTHAWRNVLQSIELAPKKILEIGSYEGRSTTWMIENLISPDVGELVCIDTWKGGFEHDASRMDSVEARFDHNIRLARQRWPLAVVRKIKADSTLALAELITTGYLGCFDLVYIDGSHLASDVLSDLTLSYVLCRTGGLIICDDYVWGFGHDPRHTPKMAIDAFTNCYSDRLQIVRAWLYQVYMVKIGE